MDLEELKKAIGKRVAAERAKVLGDDGKPISQGELAVRVSRETGVAVEQGQIGHIEVGKRFPSAQLLVALADFFGTSIDYLVGRTERDSSIAAIEEDLQTGGISGRLGDIYKTLPPDKQEEVFKFAEALALISKRNEKKVPTLFPLPLNQLQRMEAILQRMFDSVERTMGTEAREKFEEIFRDNFNDNGVEP